MRRRLLDMLAVLSFVLCLIALMALIRSHRVYDHWAMPARPASPLSGSPYQWITQRFIESALGRIRFIETTTPLVAGRSVENGYYNHSWGDIYVAYADPTIGFTPVDKFRVVLPGVEISSVPAQLDPAPPFVPAPPAVPQPISLSGMRSFSVSWWLIALITAVLPVVWGRRRWLQYRRAWRIRHNLCPDCGYDLRGSDGRCPECGLDRVKSALPAATVPRENSAMVKRFLARP